MMKAVYTAKIFSSNLTEVETFQESVRLKHLVSNVCKYHGPHAYEPVTQINGYHNANMVAVQIYRDKIVHLHQSINRDLIMQVEGTVAL